MAEKLITPICVLGAKRPKVGKTPTTFNMYLNGWTLTTLWIGHFVRVPTENASS